MTSVADDPEISTRTWSLQISIPRSSLRRILTGDLHVFPYKIQLVHQLRPRDNCQNLQYAIEFQRKAAEIDDFIDNLITSDGAHFHLNGFVNKQNSRFWGSENPRRILSMKCILFAVKSGPTDNWPLLF